MRNTYFEMIFLYYLALIPLSVVSATPEKPNIILMVADDLGIGDIGCFGNDTIRTPNVDRIAKEGVRLAHDMTTAAICTPSRAAFMTGRYQIRSGMAPHDFARVILSPACVSGLPSSEVTTAEIAKEQGYTTGLIGKWHLGLNCERFGDWCHHPLKQGYDSYYGMPMGNARDFDFDPNGLKLLDGRFPRARQYVYGVLIGGILIAYALRSMGFIRIRGFIFIVFVTAIPAMIYLYIVKRVPTLAAFVMRDFEVVQQPFDLSTVSQDLVQEGRHYLEARSKDKKPFLLNIHWLQTHTALHAKSPFKGQSAHGPYGDEIEEMDWTIGEILKALDELGLADNTFIYFSSDNGGHLEETGLHGNAEGGWNGIYRGGKGMGGMDGGIRVPTVARWPGVIPAGSVVDVPTSQMDVLPTVANMIHGNIPTDRTIDGVDIGDILRGEVKRVPHDFLVHYCGDQVHAVRYTPGDGSDVYKAFYGTPKWLPGTQRCEFVCGCHGSDVNWHDPPLLYNVAKDPSETTPLNVNDSKYREIVEIVGKRLKEHKQSIVPVDSQFWHSKMLPRPWLQPCCDWPHCYCKDES